MYSQIHRASSQKKKLEVNDSDTDSEIILSQNYFDEVETSLKTFLARDCSDWAQVTDAWRKSFNLRRQELLQPSFDMQTFLLNWPRIKDSKATDLVIDFFFFENLCFK